VQAIGKFGRVRGDQKYLSAFIASFFLQAFGPEAEYPAPRHSTSLTSAEAAQPGTAKKVETDKDFWLRLYQRWLLAVQNDY
jgi:hypothetical protein